MSAERTAILLQAVEAMINGDIEAAASFLEQGTGELPSATSERQRLRARLAGLAMQAQIAAGSDADEHAHLIARRAVKSADALIAELAK